MMAPASKPGALQWLRPLRLLPLALAAMAVLAVVKLERVLGGGAPQMASALASAPAAPPAPAASAPPIQAAPAPPAAQAERELLENLRARRLELDRQAEELAQRELLLGATERRNGRAGE